jgi:hypothetical protein
MHQNCYYVRVLSQGEIEMKKMSLSVAAAAVLAMTAATSGFATELPSYEKAGFPVSAVHIQVLGGANVGEQPPVATSAASPHQLSVLIPRSKIATMTTAAQGRTETTGRAIR